MAKILSGKDVSEKITKKIMEDVNMLKENMIFPTLAVVRVGNREDDIAYENSAVKKCDTLGVNTIKFSFPEKIDENLLIESIKGINENKNIHGVLLFRPLPKHINDRKVRETLLPEKDVDGITDISMAGVYSDSGMGFPPCTPRSCMEILDYYNIELTGKNVVVVGRSLVVGKPAAMMAMKKNATVTICHTKTANLHEITKKADILIAAAGIAKSVGPDFVNENQIIIDVGINFTDEGIMCGDVDFEKVNNLVGALTPVPGGVGTVTTAVLVMQVVEAAKKQMLNS